MSINIEFDITVMINDDVESIKILYLQNKLNVPVYILCAKYDSIKILEYIHQKNPCMKNNYFVNSDAMYIAINNGSIKVFSYIIDNGFYFSDQIKTIILDKYTSPLIQMIGKKKIMQVIENSVFIISVDNVVNYRGEQISTYKKSILEDEICKPIKMIIKLK